MVYRRNNLKVLLGPAEKLQKEFEQRDKEDAESNEAHLYIKSASRRNTEETIQSAKSHDSSVSRRARPVPPLTARPKLERYPSGLELSGHKVEKDGDAKAAKIKSVKSAPAKESANETRDIYLREYTDEFEAMYQRPRGTQQFSRDIAMASYSPSITKTKPVHGNKRAYLSTGGTLSKYFMTDFGLRPERTDTFSGHYRRRGVAGSDFEKQMEQKAERHIRACQVVGHVKRSSKAQMGCQGLRNAVSPRASPMAFYANEGPTKTFVRDDRVDSDTSKQTMVPYMIQIRKSVGSISRMKTIGRSCQKNDPLPEISGRTLLVGTGFDLRYPGSTI